MLWGRCFQVCAAFSQVSFTEKTQQGRQTLQRDFPGSCTFQDALHVLPDTLQANLSKESTMTSVPYKTHAYCHTHSGSCSLPAMPTWHSLVHHVWMTQQLVLIGRTMGLQDRCL